MTNTRKRLAKSRETTMQHLVVGALDLRERAEMAEARMNTKKKRVKHG